MRGYKVFVTSSLLEQVKYQGLWPLAGSLMYGSPQTRYEQVQIVNILDLFNESRNVLAECDWVYIVKDVEINPMTTAMEERGTISFAGAMKHDSSVQRLEKHPQRDSL